MTNGKLIRLQREKTQQISVCTNEMNKGKFMQARDDAMPQLDMAKTQDAGCRTLYLYYPPLFFLHSYYVNICILELYCSFIA